MFVVIVLAESKFHLIVPEQWVYDLNEFKLRNWGVNSNQKHLVYWNRTVFDTFLNEPKTDIQPNFDAEIRSVFGTKDECCFHGYLIKFWSKCFYITKNEFEYKVAVRQSMSFASL